MIEQLTGKISHKSIDYAVLNVSGIGYKIFVAPDTLTNLSLSKEQTLWTHLAVRENSLDLYGFTEREDLKFFELLIGISGIGPKSALGVLSMADTDTLKNAISSGETSYLTKVSGIGKKSAERIVIELKDKVGSVSSSNSMQEESDTVDALVAMGYSLRAVQEALKKLPSTATTTKVKIKEVLKLLT